MKIKRSVNNKELSVCTRNKSVKNNKVIHFKKDS